LAGESAFSGRSSGLSASSTRPSDPRSDQSTEGARVQPLAMLPPGARDGSIPPSARRSAEHARALRAAEPLGVRVSKKLLQRPLMSVWEATGDVGAPIALTVVDACATASERVRILDGAQAMHALATQGVLRVSEVREDADAFLSLHLAHGTA